MVAVLTQLLYVLVRKRIPNGPRCFRIRGDILSGPSAYEFLDALIASKTSVDVIRTFGSDGVFCRLLRVVLDCWEGFFVRIGGVLAVEVIC